MYMEQPFAPIADATRASQQNTRATVTATGKKETIAGYKCEHYLVADADGANVDACVARGLGSFMQAPSGNPMAGGASTSTNDWTGKLGKDGFPLKVTKGNTTVMEVTKIEKAPLDPSLFSAPDGWKKFDMPNIRGMRPPFQR